MNIYTIRPFTYSDLDFSELVALDKLIFGAHAGSVEVWREDYLELEAVLNKTFFVERNDKVAMSVQFHETPSAQEEGKVRLWVMCDPADTDPDLYSAAFTFLEERLVEHKITRALGPIREDTSGWLAELSKNGFEKVQYQVESELDLTIFDGNNFQSVFTNLMEEGISIRSLQDLMNNDADWLPKLYEMQEAARIDIPRPSGVVATKLPLAEWQKVHLRNSARPEFWYVAVTNAGEYVGMGNCHVEDETTDAAGIGFVGVLREYRRMGIATALKVASMIALKEEGFNSLRTNNDENNPMLQLNLALGFVRMPSWITMEKRYSHSK